MVNLIPIFTNNNFIEIRTLCLLLKVPHLKLCDVKNFRNNFCWNLAWIPQDNCIFMPHPCQESKLIKSAWNFYSKIGIFQIGILGTSCGSRYFLFLNSSMPFIQVSPSEGIFKISWKLSPPERKMSGAIKAPPRLWERFLNPAEIGLNISPEEIF